MQTNFTETQLKDKDNQSSEKIFKKCVHCGMCNATCPTYGILGDELDGPRGRIYLIKDMLENNIDIFGISETNLNTSNINTHQSIYKQFHIHLKYKKSHNYHLKHHLH